MRSCVVVKGVSFAAMACAGALRCPVWRLLCAQRRAMLALVRLMVAVVCELAIAFATMRDVLFASGLRAQPDVRVPARAEGLVSLH